MKRLLSSVTGTLCLALLSLPAHAHWLDAAIAEPDCDSQTIKLTFTGNSMEPGEYFVNYTINLDPTDGGPRISISGTFTGLIIDVPPLGHGAAVEPLYDETYVEVPLTGDFLVSGRAILVQNGITYTDRSITNADGERTFKVNCTSPLASLGDFVWEDVDRDGIQDDGEPGIDGVDVLLTNCGDSSIPANVFETTVTANGGIYLFNDLDAGNYCVEFDESSAEGPDALNCDASFSTMNAGSDDLIDSDANPTTGTTASIILAAGEQNLTVDAGLSCPELGSLGDFVWQDLNADGVQDPNEPGIGGVTVNLFGQCNTENPVFVDDDSTDENGSYLFNDLPAGEYYCVKFVESTAETALNCAADFSDANNAATTEALDSDANTDTGFTSVISLGEGADNPNIDAGLYCPAKLGDFVWDDLNRDGIQDNGEPGIEGVTVNLYSCVNDVRSGSSMGSTTTDANGEYTFEGLTPGEYAVEFIAPSGYVPSPKDAGNDASDSDASTADGFTACVELESNDYDETIDAGLNQPPAGLGDLLWEDLNANGLQDGDELGIDGARVTLYEAAGDSCDTTETGFVATTSTVNGFYEFLHLDPRSYCVVFENPQICDLGTGVFTAGVFTAQNVGVDVTVDSDVNSAGQTGIIDLAPNQYDPTNDAGIYCPAKIGDTVWKDTDKDGSNDDPDEDGVPGVTVELFECNAGQVGDQIGGPIFTDASGMYMFGGLQPGSYAVKFSGAQGLDFTEQDADGVGDDVDSDADSSGFTPCTAVESNEYNDTLDAGLIDPPDCGLGLVKTCEIIAPPPLPLEDCDGKIQSFTMIWNGLGNITVGGITNDAGGEIKPGDEVTFSAPIDGWDSNDNFLTISGADNGESVFHMSCSDGDMDGETDDPAFPSDCGKLNGDGKDDDDGFINDWLFEGLTDASNQVVDCTAPVTVPTSSCEFSATVASCDTLPEKPTMFRFQYTGGGCLAGTNSQGSKFDCSGAIGADGSTTVTLMTSAGETIEDVELGDLVTIEKDGSETTITLDNGSGIETIVFHTSCSAPLITGEVFGSLTLTALDGQGSGKEVLYSYLVENNGISVIDDISVTDSVFGAIGIVSSLNPGGSETLTAMSFVSETTTNVGRATAGASCEATAAATVTVLPPPKCTVMSSFNELKDDAIKYIVTNTGTSAATLDEFMLKFPSDYVAIREVKLDGAIFKADESGLDVSWTEAGVSIGSGDWTESDVSKRVLDPGESRTLEIKFTKKAKGSSSNFSGTVKFNDGDCMILL